VGRPGATKKAYTRIFSSLRIRNYRLYAAGQVISNTGTWMQRVAQDWLVLELTHGSGTALGIATGLQFLPLLLFSLWGGAIADRYSKRHILMATQATMGGLALILGVLSLTGVVQIWHVYALAFALGLVSVVDNPTRQTFAAEMVGRADMPNAIALNSAIFNLARILGPAVAGVVISLAGTPIAFVVNAGSYGAVLAGLALMRPAELRPVEPTPRAKGQVREGLAYVKARPSLWMPMLLIFFVATFGMNFQVTTALMSREVFHTGAGAFGVASAVFAVGALAGALLAARRRRPSAGLLVVTAAVFGVLEAVTALMPGYWSFLVLLVPTGLALLTFSTAANSATQLGTAPEMRGRVMGLYLLVFLGGTPLGAPLVGWVAEQFGPRMSLLAGGAVSVLAAVAVAAMLSRSRRVRMRDYLRPKTLARLVA
jgi:MFS family permease